MYEGKTYLTIGEAADRLGVSAPTLRHWEKRGLLHPAARQSGRRLCRAAELRRIALIRIWQESGMLSLDEIATVLAGRTETGHLAGEGARTPGGHRRADRPPRAGPGLPRALPGLPA